MSFEALSEEERLALASYLQCFRQILDEVSDYCKEHNVQIVDPGTMLDFGAAYKRIADLSGLAHPYDIAETLFDGAQGTTDGDDDGWA